MTTRQVTVNALIVAVVLCVASASSTEERRRHGDDKDAKVKTSRLGLGWWDPEPWIPDPLPPAPLPLPPRPPSPPQPPAPILPPAASRPFVLPEKDTFRQNVGPRAENIHCVRSNGVTLLTALVVPPPNFLAMPVFEDAPTIDPTVSADCAMRPNDPGPRSFAMHVNHFTKCGVRVQHGSDGKEWVSVTLRFPFVGGIRMAEDEHVMVMCKPQERTATSRHIVDLRGTASEGRSLKTNQVFRSERKEMSCRMSLFSKPPGGGNGFVEEMPPGATITIGQELQLRAQVREGDGWNFAVLKDVIITRTSGNNQNFPSSSHQSRDAPAHPFAPSPRGHRDAENHLLEEGNAYHHSNHRTNNGDFDAKGETDSRQDDFVPETARLVFNDGCRNPTYRPVALYHPQRDPNNPLLVTFNFKAFMFQDMRNGEALKLSAHIVACAEAVDCHQNLCVDDNQSGYGKKRKRRHLNAATSPFSNGTLRNHGNVKNFSRDIEMSISLESFYQTPAMSDEFETRSAVLQDGLTNFSCKTVVISVSTFAILLCLITTVAVAIALNEKRKSLRATSMRWNWKQADHINLIHFKR